MIPCSQPEPPTSPADAFERLGDQEDLRLLFSPKGLADLSGRVPFGCAAVLRRRSLPPVANVARDPVKRIGYTSFRGYYRSTKMGLRFPFESLLERDAMLVHDFHPNVRRFAAQPVTLHYTRHGRHRRYTPDLLVEPSGSDPFLLEVRPDERTPGRLGPLLPHIQGAAAEFGCQHVFISEKDIRAEPFYGNCRRAHRGTRFLTDENVLLIGDALVRWEPPVDLGDLCFALTRSHAHDDAVDLVLGMVALGILTTRMDVNINCSMIMVKGPNW